MGSENSRASQFPAYHELQFSNSHLTQLRRSPTTDSLRADSRQMASQPRNENLNLNLLLTQPLTMRRYWYLTHEHPIHETLQVKCTQNPSKQASNQSTKYLTLQIKPKTGQPTFLPYYPSHSSSSKPISLRLNA